MNVFQNFRKYFWSLTIFISTVGFAHEYAYSKCIKSLYLLEDCDLCGCTTNSGSNGFGTLINANFVGVRYIYQNFESRNGIFTNSPVSKESFSTYQLWAQIPIYNNIYITSTVPYQDLRRKLPTTNEQINGLGDITIIAWYKLQFEKKKNEDATPKTDSIATKRMKVEMDEMNAQKSPHSLQFGLGIKLPTGEFEEALTERVNPGFQVGTGSFDALISLGYSALFNRFGVSSLATYYLKGENKNEYRFGNQFSYGANLFYSFPGTNINVMPHFGISGDIYNSIEQYNEKLPSTNGNIFNFSLGSEVISGKFIFGGSYTTPLSQNLFGGNVEAKNRFSVYINYGL